MHGFALVDEFDEVLRHLSVEYLQSAWERLYKALRSTGLRDIDSRFRFGWLHPGVAVIDLPESHQARMDPGAYFGWMSCLGGEPGPEEEETFRAVGQSLMQESPRLQWAYSYRGQLLEIQPRSFARGLEAFIRIASEDPCEWDPRWVAHKGDPDAPWRRAAAALLESDPDAYREALLLAEAVYSPDGYRIMVQGFESWLQHPEWRT